MKIHEIKDKIMWTLYYKYKCINIIDDNGAYSLWQKAIMFLHITYASFIKNEYWSIDKIKDNIEYDSSKISDIFYSTLNRDCPCMIARFGAIEQTIVANYISIINKKRNFKDCITGKRLYWWWDKKTRMDLTTNAGFFPNETEMVNNFCRKVISDTDKLDVLCTWFGKEPIILGKKEIIMVGLQEMEPWWQNKPWTKVLEGRNVLVIHPFAEQIEQQYKNYDKLFENKDVLPLFNLKTIKAVQSIGGYSNKFNNWFEALEWMEHEMETIEFDIALIGCGAYGFSLAAYAKSLGKKAIHMGGALQLLFGIKGARWEDKSYHPLYNYTKLFNEYWVRPLKEYIPDAADSVENRCYW